MNVRLHVRLVLASLALALPALAQAQTAMTVGQLHSAATQLSIGLEWDIAGDTDHDAQGTVQFRVVGSTTWRPALPLIRVDLDPANTLAGSILFLTPNTTYEVQVTVSDPDGGSGTQTINVTTMATPVFPSGRTLHAAPGTSGGDGSAGNPYKGMATAWANALPGDTVLLHAGSYGTVSGSGKPSGTAGNEIVFKAAGDGAAVLEWIDLRYVNHIWIDGLTFTNTNKPLPAGGVDSDDYTAIFACLLNAGYDEGYQTMTANVDGILITHSTFNGYKHAIRGGPRANNWVVTDNVIVGNRTWAMKDTPSFDGEGVEVGGGSNHIVAYNSITKVADGISPGASNAAGAKNIDIYGNDIFDVTDDGIELDGAGANTRVWGNRIHNSGHNGFSFQPQTAAPWYIIRNQVVNAAESIFKFRDWDRYVIYNNTFVNWGFVLGYQSDGILTAISRNNLFVAANGGPIWQQSSGATKDWRTNLDYDGFDWSGSYAFNYGGTNLTTIAALTSASGQEAHGIRISRSTCFATFNVPGGTPTTIPPQMMTLQPTCAAVDAGVVLPNISDGYTGAAPDLGAYEIGAPPPQYGPRSTTAGQLPSAPTNLRIVPS
jgi:hypothetical protein